MRQALEDVIRVSYAACTVVDAESDRPKSEIAIADGFEVETGVERIFGEQSIRLVRLPLRRFP